MDFLSIINAIVVSLGIPMMVGSAIYIGKKLQILEDLRGIRSRFDIVESRVGDLWADRLAPARSPRQLNAKGADILDNSGIKEIIDEKKPRLLELIKAKKAANAYDAEAAIQEVVAELPKYCPDTVDTLKNGAFKVGAEIDGVLFVGSIYLRNLIFEDLGFRLDDLDKKREN